MTPPRPDELRVGYWRGPDGNEHVVAVGPLGYAVELQTVCGLTGCDLDIDRLDEAASGLRSEASAPVCRHCVARVRLHEAIAGQIAPQEGMTRA